MHIDGTFIPLGPGKILVNPKRPCITGNHKSFFTYQGQMKVRFVLKSFSMPPPPRTPRVHPRHKPPPAPRHPRFFSPLPSLPHMLLFSQKALAEIMLLSLTLPPPPTSHKRPTARSATTRRVRHRSNNHSQHLVRPLPLPIPRSTCCRTCSRAGTSSWRSRPPFRSRTRFTSLARGRRAATCSCWTRSGWCARPRRSQPSGSSRSGVLMWSRCVRARVREGGQRGRVLLLLPAVVSGTLYAYGLYTTARKSV